MSRWKHQGIIALNDLKFLFIPKDEKLFIGHCFVDGVICDKEDFDKNFEMIRTLNKGLEKQLVTIFLDELKSPIISACDECDIYCKT